MRMIATIEDYQGYSRYVVVSRRPRSFPFFFGFASWLSKILFPKGAGQYELRILTTKRWNAKISDILFDLCGFSP
jgi:hypothetical protein